MSTPKVVDRVSALWLIEYMIGAKAVGVAGDEEITAPYSPEARAHLMSALGKDFPSNPLQMNAEKAAPIVAYLRSVCYAIDPPAKVDSVSDLLSALINILPMAKGFNALANSGRNNAQFILDADAAIAKAVGENQS